MTGAQPDLLDQMMGFEQGELDEDQVVELFQRLVDNGMAWKLQGTYGRTATDLIDAGLVTPIEAQQAPDYLSEGLAEDASREV
jgi:hypothetical protein